MHQDVAAAFVQVLSISHCEYYEEFEFEGEKNFDLVLDADCWRSDVVRGNSFCVLILLSVRALPRLLSLSPRNICN